MRLLLCRHCKSLEELPDYDGPPENDRLLEELVRHHRAIDNAAHEGNVATLMKVENRDWEKNKSAILNQLKAPTKDGGFGEPWIQDSHNTYLDDALKCFRRHHRPTEGCIDYRDPSKLIGRPTKEGRKAAKQQYKAEEASGVSVCSWCPVHTWVQTQKRFQAGLYKDN